jgi:hypothetical protein
MKSIIKTLILLLILANIIFSQTNPIQDGSLEFDQTQGHHVNHGFFWKPGVNYGVFFWEAWVKPYNDAQYVISDGYGGSHNLLFGFSGGSGEVALAGNFWNTSTNSGISFGTDETVRVNQWSHIAVGWDGAKIVTYLNGVPSGIVLYSGERSTIVGSGAGVLFIGGSDHSNFNGKIARVRGFEGVLPVETLLGAFHPETYFRSTFLKQNGDIITAAFLADYSTNTKTYPDLSVGFNGVNHVGILSNGIDNGYFGYSVGNSNSLPRWTSESVTQPIFNQPPISFPQNAIIFDSFSREDNSPAFRKYYGLGKLEKSNSRLARNRFWRGSNIANWGILNGRAVNFDNSNNPAWIETSTSNMDVQVSGLRGAYSLGNVGLVYRYEDDSNYGFVYTSNGIVYLVEKVNGNFALTATGTQLPIWNRLRVVANGTSVKVYLNDIERIAITTNNLLDATKAGLFGTSGTMERFDNFTVYQPTSAVK